MDVYTISPMQRTIPFLANPVPHSPSPFGFGFGLGASSTSFASPQPLPMPIRTPPTRQATSNKRRHEPDAEEEDSNMMGRSPSPDRPKRAIGKRMRVEIVKPTPSQGNQKSATEPQDTVDVGVLLASLPPASLLPILTSLVTQHPSLKPILVGLIPRPTLDTALQALTASARKVRDAYPYAQPSSTLAPSASFGFGVSRSNFAPATPAQSPKGGMRDTYVQSRLRPVISEFVSTALSYLSYFSSAAPSDAPGSKASTSPTAASVLPHPSETFTYLHTLAGHVHRLPPIARQLLLSEFGSFSVRMILEWTAWVHRIDEHVNRAGGMYGDEAARVWYRGLEEMVVFEEKDLKEGVSSRGEALPRPIRGIRDSWVAKVGWLIGRAPSAEHVGMDEDEEL